MESLALLLAFPLAWPFVAKAIFKRELTLAEMGINIVVGVIVVVIGWYGGRHMQMRDIEIINGQVTSKDSRHVSCSHSYSCNCRKTCSGSGQNKSCSETCDTCYEHSYDVDWELYTTIGTIKINRVDRQGVHEPPRFSRARTGDPVAMDHAYENYIKGAPDSLFNTASEQLALAKYRAQIPAYPDNIYDYHYINRILSVGVAVPEIARWNDDLALRLRTLGPAKQVNVIVVFVKDANPDFANALRAAWLGGKKNDVIVVFGTTNYPAIDWVRVISWSDKELFKVQLRDELFFKKTIDRTAVLDTIEAHIKKDFVRKPMRDFEYLKHEIVPPMWLLIVLFILSGGASIATSVALSRNMQRA